MKDETQYELLPPHRHHPVDRAAGWVMQAITAAKRFQEDDGQIVAGHLAFITVLSFFPFLLLLVSVAGLFGQTDTGARFAQLFLELLPPEVSDPLSRPIQQSIAASDGGLLTLGLVGTIWSASEGLDAIRKAINRAYGTRHAHPAWRQRLESIGLVLLAAVTISIAMSVLIFGPAIWAGITAEIDLPQLWDLAGWALRVALPAVLLFMIVWALYSGLPSPPVRPLAALPGTITVLALWLGAAWGFSIYVRNFGDFAVTYGSLGGAILCLVFFYILGAIFIYGAELNAVRAEWRRLRLPAPTLTRRFRSDN